MYVALAVSNGLLVMPSSALTQQYHLDTLSGNICKAVWCTGGQGQAGGAGGNHGGVQGGAVNTSPLKHVLDAEAYTLCCRWTRQSRETGWRSRGCSRRCRPARRAPCLANSAPPSSPTTCASLPPTPPSAPSLPVSLPQLALTVVNGHNLQLRLCKHQIPCCNSASYSVVAGPHKLNEQSVSNSLPHGMQVT